MIYPIPEDLKEAYEFASDMKRFTIGTYSDQFVKELIERIAKLEAENKRLKALKLEKEESNERTESDPAQYICQRCATGDHSMHDTSAHRIGCQDGVYPCNCMTEKEGRNG